MNKAGKRRVTIDHRLLIDIIKRCMQREEEQLEQDIPRGNKLLIIGKLRAYDDVLTYINQLIKARGGEVE